MNATKWDSKVLLVAGAGLMLLAATFLWQDLAVRPEVLVAVAAVAAAGLTVARVPRQRPIAGPLALIATGLVGGFWYAFTNQPMLLVALGVTAAASVVAVLRARQSEVTREDRLLAVLTWYGMAIATIATSWALYFHFLTLGYAQEELGRRLLLTLGWLVAGVALVLYSKKRGQTVIRDTGFLFLAVSVGKALLYDTTHLFGGLRIAVLGVAGALLLAGGLLTSRAQAQRS